MMNKKKVLTSLVLGTAMVSQVAVPVFAKEQTNETPNQTDAEWKQDSHTTIGIAEISEKDAKEDNIDKTQNVTFEVPLYVTSAAVENDADLKTPTTYDIKNGGNRGIVVTAMKIEKLAAWDTVATDAEVAGAPKKVHLSIGKLTMSATNKVNEKVDVPVVKTGQVTAFNNEMKYKVIGKGGETLSTSKANKNADTTIVNKVGTNNVGLNISGKIDATTRKSVGAAAQFKVTYTVSAITKDADDKYAEAGNDGLVDNNGVIGLTYVGDDKAASGMATK